ncbi:MFS transporter [Streptomyces sp. NPDC059814]|uniref:MFS transporter n=1 Tax=unclassified Streptomyces TaxID=2593676 RepID=UPI00364E6BCA
MLSHLLPSAPLTRRLSMQAALFALGQGSFLAGSAFYFTRVIGLSAAEVGLGHTVAGVVIFLVAVPLGRATDRLGPRKMWALGAGLQGALYLVYPWVHGFGTFLAILVAIYFADAAGRAGRGAYMLSAFAGEERIKSLAYVRSALNAGFAVGALLGGATLAVESTRFLHTIPMATGTVMLVNAVLIARLPGLSVVAAPAERSPSRLGALRNRGFLLVNVALGVLSTNQVLLNVVIPLWLVEETDAPRWLLAWLFATHTVLVVVLQVRASRVARTLPGALAAGRLSAACTAATCVVVVVASGTSGWTTIALIWCGYIVLTGAALFHAAADWGVVAELSDPARRGEYQGVVRVGNTLGTVWAPAVYTFVAMNWAVGGWLVIGVLALGAAAAARPAAGAAERYLRTHALPETDRGAADPAH